MLLFSIFSLPLFSTAQSVSPEFTLVQTGPGLYRVDIYGLSHLDKLQPEEIYDDPRYELFIELGDGYYLRKTMDNPQDERDTFSVIHQFSIREPQPELIQVTATPIYSPEKKPEIPDAAPALPDSMTWSPTGGTSGVKYDFVPGGKMVKADLNWSMFEAGDMFVVIAGYQNGTSNTIGNLSDGGFLSVYYDSGLVEPLRTEGDLEYRAYDKNAEQSISFVEDQVIQDHSDDKLNAHLDFEIPPMSQGQEEFVFVTFQIHDSETIGETEGFPVYVVVRGLDDTEPTNTYEFESAKGEIKVGKDPNYITGYPRPVCAGSEVEFFRYHIEFFNEGEALVDSVQLDITLPVQIAVSQASDIEILSARFGSPDLIPPHELTYGLELLSTDPLRIRLPVAQNGYLNGYSDPSINNRPEYYPYCSSEFELKIPRDVQEAICGDSAPLTAELAVTFPSGEVVTRRDTIPCGCLEEGIKEADTPVFPCNIVPAMPVFGSCWGTFWILLLILALLIAGIVILISKSS